MGKKLQIRNSTIDFLVFTRDAGESSIEVRVQDNNVWLTQMGMGKLFDVERSVVTKHLKNVYAGGELDENSTCANFAQVADNGKTYQYKFYAMADWAAKLDVFLKLNDAEILQDKAKVSAAVAKAFAESEFEQYRIIQDRLYQSDFDRLLLS